MLYPSNDLRRGRRRLEEIEEISIIDDLTWDNEYKCFFICVSVQLDKEYPQFPKITKWYITIDSSYPLGEISIYPSNSNGINCTFPHQLNNYFIAKNNLWRLGKICLDFSLRNLGMRSPEKEPFTTDERLFWHAKRAVMWIQCAAKNELVSPGDYFELPDYTSQHTEVFAFNEDIVSMMHWEDADVNCGIAKTQHLYSSNISCVTVPLKFTSADEKETVYIPCWANSILECKDSTIDNALWLKLSSPLVVNGWQAPMTFGELQQACVAQGIDFFMHLKTFASKVRDGKSHLVLFGFPVSKHYGEPPSEIVWQALKLPILSHRKYVNRKFQSGKKGSSVLLYGVPDGFRPNETGWWQNDILNHLAPSTELEWIESQNWSSRIISARGCYSSNISSKRFAIIGSGSLGATIAELLVRAGVTHLTCIDGDRLEIGNLCRHTLTMSDLTRQKSLALSSHLSSINPHVDVSANPCYLKIDSNGCISPNIGDYDIIIDTTGDDYVLELVTMGINWSKSILLSASVGLGAKRLYLFFARNIRPDFTHFLDFVTPYLIKDSVECNLAELPRNGIGCWHPLFPARADDMWMAAGTAVKALELFISRSTSNLLYSVYESNVVNDMFCGYTPTEVKHNDK